MQGGWLKRRALAVERCLFRRFQRVSSISPRMVERLAAKGVPDDRRVLFPNWVDCDEIRPLALDLGRRLEVTRCLWLQARLAAAEGLADRALRTFQQVRRDLEGQQKPHDLAEVELEILALYLDLGDGHQVRTKAAEIGWVETTPSLPEPVKAALPPLREAGRQGKEAVLPLRKAQAELRRHRPRVRP